MKQSRGTLYVISSPSGGGKSTVINEILKIDPDLSYSISATTRAPRANEKDGKDYFFLSEKDFFKLIEQDRFIEWAKVHDCYYGTLREQIEEKISKGEKIILDIDVQGGLNIKKSFSDSVLIFLWVPSLQVLEQRLRNRGTENEKILKKRMTRAKEEFKKADHYDYIIVNNKLKNTIKEVLGIIKNT
ncbi:MAG: guanylate kinase [bacterium]